MTKKDFELIARVLSEEGQAWVDDVCIVPSIAYNFADVLSSTNPRFDRERFLCACGVTA